MLLKATGRRAARGRPALRQPTSRESRHVRAWISRRAAPRRRPAPPALKRLDVTPRGSRAGRAGGRSVTVQATGRFLRRQPRDVTGLAVFEPSNPAVTSAATASCGAAAPARRPWWCATSTGRRRVPARVRAGPPASSGTTRPRPTTSTAHVFARLQQLRMNPSGPVRTDSVFLRRPPSTPLGVLPTPEEARTFLADTRPDKRATPHRRPASPAGVRRLHGDISGARPLVARQDAAQARELGGSAQAAARPLREGRGRHARRGPHLGGQGPPADAERNGGPSASLPTPTAAAASISPATVQRRWQARHLWRHQGGRPRLRPRREVDLRQPGPYPLSPAQPQARPRQGKERPPATRANVWGKEADWCDISGQINGKSYGVAILNSPTNPLSAKWHPSTVRPGRRQQHRHEGLRQEQPEDLHPLHGRTRQAGDLPVPGNRARGRREEGWGSRRSTRSSRQLRRAS